MTPEPETTTTGASDLGPGGLLEAFERAALLLAAIVIAIAAIVLPPHAAFSLTVGAALAAANAVLFNRLGGKMARARKSPAVLVVVFQAKLLVLAVLIFLAMRYLGVEGVPFAFGISVLPASVFTASLFRRKSSAPVDSPPAVPNEEANG